MEAKNMKRNENKKSNRNRSLVVLLVLCAMLAVTLIGCKKPAEENPAPSTPTSEVESEVISEEVSEPVSEEVVSEEPVEETMDLTPYTIENGKKVVDLINDMEYNEFKVIVWSKGIGAKTILSNGDSYQIQNADEYLYLYYPNQMQSVQSDMDYVRIEEEYETDCTFNVYGTGENIEVTFTGTDVEGKEYEITFYLTKDWLYDWE